MHDAIKTRRRHLPVSSLTLVHNNSDWSEHRMRPVDCKTGGGTCGFYRKLSLWPSIRQILTKTASQHAEPVAEKLQHLQQCRKNRSAKTFQAFPSWCRWLTDCMQSRNLCYQSTWHHDWIISFLVDNSEGVFEKAIPGNNVRAFSNNSS